MKYCHYLFVALGITSAAILASCQDEDFGYTADQIAYRTNFEKMYGSVKDIPTWDFSSYNLHQMGLAGGPEASGMTRALADNYSGTVNTNLGNASDIIKSYSDLTDISGMSGEWYSVPSNTLQWLDKSLPEGEEYEDGKSFVLGKPTDNFAIIPVYQGHSGMNWELHLVDKGTNNDYKLWEKSEGICYSVDFDANNAIDVARHEIKDWGIWVDVDKDGYDDDCGDHQKYIPIGYLFKAWEPSFGDLVLSCDLPSTSCYFNGRIVDFTWDGENHIGQNVDFKVGEKLEFSSENQTYTIPATEVAKMKANADNLFFELWWNNEWVTSDDSQKCYFDFYNSKRATFHLTTSQKSPNSHVGKIFLTGCVSNEVGHTVGKASTGVQAKPILIDGSKIAGDMYLYLKITKRDLDNPGYATLGACQRSDENMMVALPIKGEIDGIVGTPGNIGGNEHMIIGCEDANNVVQTSGYNDLSDWDYNDIVFLLVGQGELPKVKEIIAEKRYMIEDLGSTFDFDFNDIVVDVTQTRVTDYKGDAVGDNDGKTTTAVIRHLCGTIPFQVHIGNTSFEKLPGKVDCNPALDQAYSGKYEMTGVDWDPTTNNITVTVWPKKAGAEWDNAEEDYYLGLYPEESSTFRFPESGEFPYIIACNQDVNWRDENESVPEDWFRTWPKQYYDYNDKPRPTPTDSPVTPPTPSPVSIFTYSGNKADYSGIYEENTFIKINLGTQLQNKGINKVIVKSNTAITSAAFGCSSTEWKETSFTVEANSSSEVTLSADILSQINGGGDLVIQIYGINLDDFDFSNFDVTYTSAN